MDHPRFSRREALRGAAGTTAAVALAGCLDAIPFVGEDANAPSVGPVPAGSTAFATVDGPALRDAGPLRELAGNAVPFIDAADVLGSLRDQFGLDPEQLATATAFGSPTASDVGSAGVVFEAGWSIDDLTDSLARRGYGVTETTVDGNQAYDIDETGVTLSKAGGETFVLGVNGGTLAAIESSSGARDSVRRGVRRAYGQASSGPIQFGIDIRNLDESITRTVTDQVSLVEDLLSDVRFASGSLYGAGDQAGLELGLTGDDRIDDLKNLAQAVPGFAPNLTDDQALLNALDRMDVSRDGKRVTMTIEGTVEQLQPVADRLGQRLSTLWSAEAP